MVPIHNTAFFLVLSEVNTKIYSIFPFFLFIYNIITLKIIYLIKLHFYKNNIANQLNHLYDAHITTYVSDYMNL